MPDKTKNPFNIFDFTNGDPLTAPVLSQPPSFAPPPMPTTAASTSPWAMLAPLFAPQQQQGIDWNAIQNIVRKPDVQGERNRAYAPGRGGEGSPWAEPIRFEDAATRYEKMKGYGPAVGIPPRTDVASNPYAFGAIAQTEPKADAFVPQLSQEQLRRGAEGMINPALPDDQKYKDANFWRALPGQSSLPPGMVAGDGSTNYRRTPDNPALQQQAGQVMQMLKLLGFA